MSESDLQPTPGTWWWTTDGELVSDDNSAPNYGSVIELEVSCGSYGIGCQAMLRATDANRTLIKAAPVMLAALRLIHADDWPGMIALAQKWGVLPDKEGAADPHEYEWKGDHGEDARYTSRYRAALLDVLTGAAIAAAEGGAGER